MNLQEIRNIREGMTWGTEEHGIPQLTEKEVFLLRIIETLEDTLNITINCDGKYIELINNEVSKEVN